ncbi:hypothetical protein SBOR_3455 [Sclerotinia borealis F-4128]|uniref:CUE domain-containing protein n=1 Tax=Sclerotinia borealis (strain F-4128) TaxID=1432307 RepID=W9CNU8_SCLBF|nr:hypothetical protein SBOR_3455 [Sclerotinia borealis F-4128]
MASKSMVLPPLVPYPKLSWRSNILPKEWEACLDAWISLFEVHLSFSTLDFTRTAVKDESLPNFLASYFAELALSHDENPTSKSLKPKQLRKQAYLLFYRLMSVDKSPESLLRWEVLSDLCKVYGKEKGGKITTLAWSKHSTTIEASLSSIKSLLTEELDAGLKGDLKGSEIQLRRLNHLLHASPEAASFFMAGDDFVDSLISCYKLMNPPLRKVIISSTYLCIIGLTEGPKPRLSSLVDQLYSLNAAAEAHKNGPTNVNDSLVAELVTVTPVLKQIQQRIDASGSGSSRARSVITTLQGFRKPGGSGRPPRLVKKKPNKGKGLTEADDHMTSNIHVHQMSLISQVQDLFPDLGSGFIVKLLEEYHDNTEEVISHLLDGSLPPSLEYADQSEELSLPQEPSLSHADLAPHSTPPQIPTRRNIFDDDELDQLTVDASRLHFGRRNPDQTADDVLQDRSTAHNKAAILSALAAFDSDDDERDDTYDVADVGGTVDSTNPEEPNPENSSQNAHDEALFRAFKSSPSIFARDATTRRSKERAAIKQETGMTDEALEGWAVMLSRDPRQMRRLETRFATFKGEQGGLESTAWRAVEGEEDGNGNGNRGRGGKIRGQGRGGRGGGRGGRGGGNVAGTSGDKETDVARQRKEANKGSSANHNRRDGRAKKMARGGFPG